MTIRPKIFYLDSEITFGLYTSGKEYMLPNGTEYIGWYHKYNDGMVMTESTYDINKSKFLVKLINDEVNKVYTKVSSVTVPQFETPIKYFLVPKPQDYNYGFVTRYFIKRINSSEITEISPEQYEKLQTGKLDSNMYTAIQLNWKLTGPLHDSYDLNNILIPGVEDTNKRTIARYNQEFVGLNELLKNPIEFYKNL